MGFAAFVSAPSQSTNWRSSRFNNTARSDAKAKNGAVPWEKEIIAAMSMSMSMFFHGLCCCCADAMRETVPFQCRAGRGALSPISSFWPLSNKVLSTVI